MSKTQVEPCGARRNRCNTVGCCAYLPKVKHIEHSLTHADLIDREKAAKWAKANAIVPWKKDK